MHAVLDDVILLRKLELEASLTNDNILSDAERSRGLDLLAEAQTALSSINRQITLFQYSDAANIEAWISVRDEIEARVISMRIGLAPHKTLPSELISQIFLHCQGGNEVVKFPITKTKTPWVLGMVCRRWRIIACGDHALWKRISVDVDACRPGTIEFVEQIIRERGTSSLSLSLIMGWCNDASSSSNMAITMRLVPYFPRLQHLDLSLPTSLFLRLLDLPPEDFSSIESLKLTIIHNTANKSNNNITNDTGMFSNAPLLRRLELSTSHSPTLGIIVGLQIPWGQLTDLDLLHSVALKPSTIHHILRDCLSLVNLSLPIHHYWPRGAEADLKLPHLSSLTLIIQNTNIFRNLHVPALAELHISGRACITDSDLVAMIRRSGCTITVLDYDGVGAQYDAHELHNFLEHLPSLKSFSTFFLVIKEHTLQRIACGALLPRIETVQIRVDCPEAFVDMLASRFPSEAFVGGKTARDGASCQPLHIARGYYVRRLGHQDFTMDSSVGRLNRLNERWNTNYILADD